MPPRPPSSLPLSLSTCLMPCIVRPSLPSLLYPSQHPLEPPCGMRGLVAKRGATLGRGDLPRPAQPPGDDHRTGRATLKNTPLPGEEHLCGGAHREVGAAEGSLVVWDHRVTGSVPPLRSLSSSVLSCPGVAPARQVERAPRQPAQGQGPGSLSVLRKCAHHSLWMLEPYASPRAGPPSGPITTEFTTTKATS